MSGSQVTGQRGPQRRYLATLAGEAGEEVFDVHRRGAGFRADRAQRKSGSGT
jgi:hypothetical protein